jgi:hypothetical protein
MKPRRSWAVLGVPSQPIENIEARRLPRRLLGGSVAGLQAAENITLGGCSAVLSPEPLNNPIAPYGARLGGAPWA